MTFIRFYRILPLIAISFINIGYSYGTVNPEVPTSVQFLFGNDLCKGFGSPFGAEWKDNFLIFKQTRYGIKLSTSSDSNRHIQTIKLPPAYPDRTIRAMAKGKVIFFEAADSSAHVVIRHSFIENGKYKELDIKYGPVRPLVSIPGQQLEQGHPIGILSGDELKLETMNTENRPFFFKPPSWYVQHYRELTLPEQEKHLLVVAKSIYKIFYFKNGKLNGSYDVCLGQDPLGHKVKQGDNKTPEGEYKITEMEKGPFTGGTGPWLGDRWMHLSYPNLYDVHAGYRAGVIRKDQFESMENAIRSGKTANNYTNLGGRIGLHGWYGSFYANGSQNLTWGCVCMQNEDIVKVFDEVPMGTKVLILP